MSKGPELLRDDLVDRAEREEREAAQKAPEPVAKESEPSEKERAAAAEKAAEPAIDDAKLGVDATTTIDATTTVAADESITIDSGAETERKTADETDVREDNPEQVTGERVVQADASARSTDDEVALEVERDLIDPDVLLGDEKAPDTVIGHEHPEEGTQTAWQDDRAGAFDDLTFAETPDLEGTDPADFADDFDEAMAAGGNVGGLDGRNDAADYGGGGPTDPNAEAPAGGLEGANASPLHEHNVDRINSILNDPDKSADDKLGELDALGERITGAQEAAEAGDPAGDAPGGDPGEAPAADLPTPGTEEGGDEEGGGWFMEMLDAASEAVYDRPFFGEAGDDAPKGGGLIGGHNPGALDGVEDSDVGTADSSEVEASAKQQIDENDGVTKDFLPGEGGDLPGHLGDPSAGWGDRDEANDWFLGTGGGYTDPVDEGGTDVNAGSISGVDPDVYVGDPGAPVSGMPVVTGSELDDFDPNAPYYDEFDDV